MTEYEQNIEVMKDLRNKIDAVLATNTEGNTISIPDPKKHLYISLAKSAIRIVAGVCLIVGLPVWCGIGLVAAEALGVAEELV
jgi:hypothetical protein